MKYTFALALMFLTGLGFVLLGSAAPSSEQHTISTRIPAYTWEDLCQIGNRQEQLEERRSSATIFTALLEKTKQEIWQGDVTLQVAAERLIVAANQHSPIFLSRLDTVAGSATVREKVALTVLGHLHAELTLCSSPSEHSTVELEELLCQMAAWPELSSDARRELSKLYDTRRRVFP